MTFSGKKPLKTCEKYGTNRLVFLSLRLTEQSSAWFGRRDTVALHLPSKWRIYESPRKHYRLERQRDYQAMEFHIDASFTSPQLFKRMYVMRL